MIRDISGDLAFRGLVVGFDCIIWVVPSPISGSVSKQSLMSVSLSKIAWIKCVNQRTVRRWCQKGMVPGAYQTRGGHWRVRESKKFNRWLIFRYKAGSLGSVQPGTTFGDRLDLLDKAQLLLRGFVRSDFDNGKIFERDPELEHEMYTKPYAEFITPQVRRMVDEHPDAIRVATAALELYREGVKLTASNLAAKLSMSRATLYRRYPNFREFVRALDSHQVSRLIRD